MSLNRLALGATGAFLALALGVGSAAAASAYASSTVNVRAGAGTSYAVVDVLRRGQRVDVDYCRGAWCLISQRGADGWVNANYLTADSYNDDYYDDDYGYDDDFYIERPRYRHRVRPFYPSYRSQVCVGGPNSSFCIRD